uniref:WD_REPEATS_REGION domain-containing protein n=1 Tax=Globodera pallida TaxID=36090 RepID=A0A183CTE9_GLOPA
ERRLFVDGGPPKLLLSLTDSLVVVDSANSIHLFDVRSGQPLVRLDSTASFDITAIILVGAADGRMRLWNLCSGRLVHEFPVCDAAQVAGSNALVMHEQAATAFMENDFKKAEQILMEALRLLVVHAVVVVVDDGDPNVGGQQSVEQLMAAEVSDFWEPLYNNLGHVLRKLGRYTDAIHVHRSVRRPAGVSHF